MKRSAHRSLQKQLLNLKFIKYKDSKIHIIEDFEIYQNEDFEIYQLKILKATKMMIIKSMKLKILKSTELKIYESFQMKIFKNLKSAVWTRQFQQVNIYRAPSTRFWKFWSNFEKSYSIYMMSDLDVLNGYWIFLKPSIRISYVIKIKKITKIVESA